ncbi:MAG: DUF2235 domain-containing protein [Pseudomonadota bacterium]
MRLRESILALFGQRRVQEAAPLPERGARKLVIILDWTLSSREVGQETNAGLAAKLLESQGQSDLAVYYEAGLQWEDWGDTIGLMTGHGINGQIRRAYGWLASRYRPGDQIFLMGYSRGAYAARSLAGIIGRIGLLKSASATERNLRALYRLYCEPERWEAARAFAQRHCHDEAEIACVAVWDTVKALGLRLPLLWMLTDKLHAFHDHELGPHVRAGFQALALDETRRAYAPVLWRTGTSLPVRVEQVWFRGTHGDVGGQLGGRVASRPLANIPFVWLMERVAFCGIALPEGWQKAFPRDPDAPSIGPFAGWSKLFWNRWRRRVGTDPSEAIHPSAQSARRAKRAQGPRIRRRSS